MNIVKKLNPVNPKQRPTGGDVSGYETSSSGGGAGTPTSASPSSAGTQPSQDRMLALMHLRKVFTDFCRSHTSSSDYEQKLYRMVPLFVKLTGVFTPDEIQAQFKEAPQFASHLSKLFVQEVRRRATNQSTESAAAAIIKYLEPENVGVGEFGGRGWHLLASLTYLAECANNAAIVEAMCHAALASTLVKSLYLFYDLPAPSADPKSVERRNLLYDSVVELMFRLLSHSAAGEELARKEDLVLLFSGVSSWCPEHNRRWRRATAQLLMTLSSRILTPTVINYVHSKNCLGLFLNNLRQAKDLTVVEQAEMIVCIFCVLKDSAVLTAALIDDWKNVNGYSYLTDFILNNENDAGQDAQDALRNLLLMFNSVVTAGHAELKPPPLTSTLFTLPGFSIPSPLGQGCSVRNTHAFEVLENVFIKSQQSAICCTVLDVITSIYSADPANYFILEPRCTLGLFAEHIHSKDHVVQAKFFELFEYVVFHLNHVPCKELLALTILLKTQSNTDCAILCMHSLFKLLSHSQVFKDVYREVGILEVLTSLLHALLDALKTRKDLTENQRNVYFLSLDMLTLLLKQNNSNANVFRECNGSKAAQGLLGFEECRQAVLILYQQLLATPGGDEELASLLALLHSSPLLEINLKIQVLKCIVYVLRESHRVRMAFRRIGGYLYTISLLVNMEGALSQPAKPPWDQVHVVDTLNQLKLIFKVLTLSMRFEPANAKFFSSEVRYSSVTDSLRLLGCFKGESGRLKVMAVDNTEFAELNKTYLPKYHEAFVWTSEMGPALPSDGISTSSTLICVIYRLLYDMALDNFEKPVFAQKKSEASLEHMVSTNNNAKIPCPTESMIVHPGAVLCMMELLPFIKEENEQITCSVQLYVAELIKSLVRSERNQQVMCEAGLPHSIFTVASLLFISEDHPLLSPFYYILERLATHGMQPKELREFLRLDRPLCSRDLDADDEEDELAKLTAGNEGGPVPLSRVKTLVSMMTPKDFRLAGVNISPPFVEFDMSVEGFGCIFLPSIAPQGGGTSGSITASAVSGVLTPAALVHSVAPTSPDNSASAAGGGLGTGERVFPPLTGLTFLSWIYVEKYSETGVDSHPIRLLTVTRSVPKGTGTSGGKFGGNAASAVDWPDMCELACLQIQISPADRCLLLATHETDTPGADLDRDVVSSETYVRVSIPELRQEQQWLHLAVVLNRAVLKNSSASVFINGRLHGTYKIHYVIQNPGGGATTLAQAAAVNAVIGTPPGPFRKQSRLLWRLGPCHLVEEAWPTQTVQQAFRLGPFYTGSYQTPVLPNGERLTSLVGEERVTFGLHARAVSQMTLARLRKVYNKIDGKAIAKQLGISSHENATPIRLLHNAAAHLNGPARSLGGVLIGYLGMRTFCPQPVPKLLESVGGMASILGLVAMAADTEGLYAAVKALLCAVRTNRTIANDMDRIRAYQTLAMLLKEKSHMLNGHVLHLLFALVGTLDSGRETTIIPNVQAFEDLLCDLLVWKKASPELQRLLYEHFYQLITESGDKGENLKIIRQVGLLGRILQTMAADPPLLWTTKEIAFNLVAAILQPPTDNASLLRFGQFIASTLPTSGPMDAEKALAFDIRDLQLQLFSKECSMDDPNQLMLYQVYVRNRCLNILLNILLHTSGNTNFQLCDQVSKVLGFDWILTLLNPRSHPATVWGALRILLALTAHAPLLQRFKEGTGNGGWLLDAESVVQNRAGVLLGFSVSARGGAVGSACDLNPEICHIPGFVVLQHLLPHHVRSPDPYLALLSLLVGQPAKDLPHVHEFDLDGIWSLIFGLPPSHSVADAISKVELCPEAAIPLLALVRRCISLNSNDVWCRQYPLTLIQFLTFLYHNVADFATYMTGEEFVTALTSVVFRASVPGTNESTNGPKTKENGLPEHPVIKPVLDLIRNILVDSFAVVPANKGDSVVDMMLELMPEGSTRQEQMAYATALLQLVMEHLVASDVLLCGQSSSLPLTLPMNSNYSTLAANVFYFTSRLVDCMWNGLYVGDAQQVFDFILKLFAQTKRKSGAGVPTDSLYSSLNRAILFMLSRFVDSVQAQASVLECLQKITSSRSLIFNSANSDPEFFACLCHLLFMLTDVSGREVPLVVGPNDRDPAVVQEETRIREGAVMVANAARRVWEEMFLAKKQALEESFRMSLVPEINAARALLGEAANRCWQNFVDSEMKGGGGRDAFQIHAQLQSKIQKVAGGLQRLASRKAARPLSVTRAVNVSYQTLELWMFRVHISLIRELVELQYTQYQQWHEHTEKWCLDEWRSIEQELTRERGLWGPSHGSEVDKWTLDSTEGPCRMRKKLVPNVMFYIHYPYRPNLDMPENKSLKGKVAISRDSRPYYERVKARRGRMLDARIIDTSSTVVSPPDDKPMLLRDMTEINTAAIRRASRCPTSLEQQPSMSSTMSIAEDDLEETSPCANGDANREVEGSEEIASIEDVSTKDSMSTSDSAEKQTLGSMDRPDIAVSTAPSTQPKSAPAPSIPSKGPDNQTLLRLLEEGEELHSMFRCARINGLETSEGLLLFGKEHYYVVDGFTLLKTREIRDLDFLPEELHDPIVPYIASGPQKQRGVKRLCSKFPYEDIREVHKRRYLLQPIALEVFSADGRNYLLAFPKKVRNKVYGKFLSVAKSLTDTAHQSVSGQRSSVNLEQGAGILGTLIGEASVTQRWVRGEISNFQYLMHLNTLAGRSYNDLSQYPVFPWVLADYDAEELDLTNAASFRDFSKAMGAQTPERLEQFMKRYREWDDPTGEIPRYFYGTHYSSAMIVVSYLVRMEPFTQQFLKLQGGHFDLADRMFHSIKEGWLSASRNNMADVKELIPEFFYLPDFLVNLNNFDFGVKQSGVPLADVILPPWAKGDPREFIRVHREALESDYVSAHLHEWIDLIFGYKQQGPAAVESHNLFHHLFYEGNVDFESIEDPLTRNATIGFINNFGQIPTQLFKKPHPSKRARQASATGGPVTFSIGSGADPSLPTAGVTTERLFFHCLDALRPPMQPVKELKGGVGQIVQSDRSGLLCAVEQNKVLAPPNYAKYFSWGFADSSIRLGVYDTDKSVCIHELSQCGEIVCASCPNNRTLVTGSTNTVVSVWDVVMANSRGGNLSLRLRKALYGHTEPVSCVHASGSYGIIVSGSKDGSCIVWDLSKLSFIRQLGPHPGPVSAVCVNEVTGDIASSSGTHLYLWDINGQLLATVNTAASPKLDSKQLILCLAFSTLCEWDPQHVVVTGSNDGVVRMWSLEYVQQPDESTIAAAASQDSEGGMPAGSEQEEKACSEKGLGNRYSSSDQLQAFREDFSAEALRQRLQENDDYGQGEPPDTPRFSQAPSPTDYCSNGADSGVGTPATARSASRDDESDVFLAAAAAAQSATTPTNFDSTPPAVMRSSVISRDFRKQSSSDSFVFVNKDGLAVVKTPNRLKKGFHWQRQLVFRSKLTMHTAFERRDNPAPAAITAVAPSKDHKTLYVGDARGRIWAWSVADGAGGRADHWVQDPARSSCAQCHQKFSLTERRHHCRNCGQIFCAKCSRFESEIRHLKISKPVRVCQNCYVRLRVMETAGSGACGASTP